MWQKNIGLGIDMDYEQFEKHMSEKFPRYFGEETRYGGFAIGEGWYHIIETLVSEIDHYTKWRRNMRARDLKLDRARDKGRGAVTKFICRDKTPSDWDEERIDDIMATPQSITEKVTWIQVQQIKEKFGGLRFYYQGGNDEISGMVRMAELWAGHTCETCGDKGHRRDGGWIRTLCDVHEKEYQDKKANFKSEDGDE
jgi:hypothetical protein